MLSSGKYPVHTLVIQQSSTLHQRAFYMDRFNGIPEVKDAEAESIMIAEYNSIIFTIPSTSLQEMAVYIG